MTRAEICNFKDFVDMATTGRHRSVSTIYLKHNLFQQSKFGRDVELQNKHIVLFEPPRDVHQVGTLNVQSGLGSTLVDWYPDAISVPFGHLLIHLSPPTNDLIRYCTNSGNIPSMFYVPEYLKHMKHLDDEHTKTLYSPSILSFFAHMQSSNSENLFKRIYPISQRIHRQPAAGKLVGIKKKSRAKLQKQNSRTIFEKNNLEAQKVSTFRAKRTAAHKNHFLIRH